MRKFKRSIRFIVTAILLGIILFYLIIQIECAEGNLCGDTLTSTEFNLVVQCLFCLVVLVIVTLTMPPDFQYCIRVSNDWVIFEISEKDHRRIDRNFIITSQKRRYIVLDDGFSRICIVYNKEVLQFLNEINND